ncbi:MAG TPA: hypothetical protein VMW64_04330 [Dehalococcoidia bacterium]|nr:hypothetical protein [Dehalococcoidia bacterium]
MGQFKKEFDLAKGDRVKITIPTASGSFPAGWSEGTVISANFYGERDGWYIESDKDKVSLGWDTGYGYWKQGMDGGYVEKIGHSSKSKLSRDDVRVEVWEERDRLHIGIQNKETGDYLASWWDDDAREMFEQGFFKSGPGLEESVLEYAEDGGILEK